MYFSFLWDFVEMHAVKAKLKLLLAKRNLVEDQLYTKCTAFYIFVVYFRLRKYYY